MGFKGVLGNEFVGRVVNIHEDAAEEVRKELLDVVVCGDINLGCCKKINLLVGYVTICWDMMGCNSNMSRNRSKSDTRSRLGLLLSSVYD
jgi:hypothetical protein